MKNVAELSELFEKAKYVADEKLVMSVYLALRMRKPLLIEGDPGCGKTEIAKVLSEGLGTRVIRLQCYEGLDVNTTIYEWNYLKQLVSIRLQENTRTSEEMERNIFSEKFLLKRPLLEAILHDRNTPPVLLIDEVDRADEEFEGFLLELLAEFQVTIPELGTFRARTHPIVVITSNNTRELGDGLRRRCLYHFMTYPSIEKELKIVKLKVPGISEGLGRQLVETVSKLRSSEIIIRKPGTSETLDWARALVILDAQSLNKENMKLTLGCVLKNSEDLLNFSTNERLAEIIHNER